MGTLWVTVIVGIGLLGLAVFVTKLAVDAAIDPKKRRNFLVLLPWWSFFVIGPFVGLMALIGVLVTLVRIFVSA